MYYVNICGIDSQINETSIKTIGPYIDSEKAVNEAEDIAMKYYRVHYLELIDENNITEIVWNLDY